MQENRIFLKNPAYDWENATPVGCGSLGAMLYGRIDEDRIVLNEEHIWNGHAVPTPDTDFRARLDEARAMFLRGENEQADRWMTTAFNDVFRMVDSYEYAGDVLIRLHPTDTIGGYRRELNLETGVATVSYGNPRKPFTRQLFSSYPRRLLVYRFSVKDEFSLSFRREHITSLTVSAADLTALCTTADGGHAFSVRIHVETDGQITSSADSISAAGATWGEAYMTVVTEYESADYIAEAERRVSAYKSGFDALL